MNKIQKFIKDNNLSLDDSGSGLNSTCCIIAGYALYENRDENEFEKLLENIQENKVHTLNHDAIRELERVYSEAYSRNYASWWRDVEAQYKYTFEPNEE